MYSMTDDYPVWIEIDKYGREVLNYKSANMVLGKKYFVTLNGERRMLRKTMTCVEVCKWVPNQK